MSETTNVDINPENEQSNVVDSNLAVPSDVSSVAGSVKTNKQSAIERQIKFERAQKCLENAALVSKRIKEHRKATAELLGRPFEDDNADAEMASTMSEKTNYSVTTDTSTTLSVQDALNIPGISESLANTLKQKELLMERIKQYKEISKRPVKKIMPVTKKVPETGEIKKSLDNTDFTKLTNTIKEKENALSIMQVKLRAMETTILDLQEKINEKDQIIESKNRATTIISDSLSKKEKDTLNLLDDTKQQMMKMQNNFVAMEMEWKQEKQKLLTEIHEKDEKIKNLEEANNILEDSRFEKSIENSKLTEELNLKIREISELQDKLNILSEQQPTLETKVEQEKGALEISNMDDLTKKIEILEQINCQIRQTNKELENQLSSVSARAKSPSVKSSPVPSRKGGRNTASKIKSPWSQLSSESLPQDSEKKGKGEKSKSELILQSLNKDILDKEIIISQKDETIIELESKIKEKNEVIGNLQSQVQLQDKQYVDVCIMTEDKEQSPSSVHPTQDVNELNEKLKVAEDQIADLNQEIEIANKNMIKVKSNSKLKIKQMQKSIDNFSKISDANTEIVKLNEELHQLSQKVAELEEEKGNLQLHLVDYDGGRLTESEVYKKLVEVENLAEARLKSITLLETQKFDLVQELHNLQQKASEMEDKLADMSILQNEQVCSEMKMVQLEEQVDNFSSSKKEMEMIIENLKIEQEQLSGTIKILENEKEDITRKLDTYIQENIDLTDKLEKLSAEKVSSAESIEIVESLTTQEKMELEEYNRAVDSSKDTVDTSSQAKVLSKEELINETEELRKKIELFTAERQEVMEKMNKISIENESLRKTIHEVQDEYNTVSRSIKFLNEEKQKLLIINEDLNHQIDELKRERIEVLKETAEVTKRASIDDAIEGPSAEIPSEDKSSADKSGNRSKSVKQLTKEILRLKNIVKEREDEIADCQMKILSLEEQQEKQKELLQTNSSYEATVKRLNDENNQLRNEISNIQKESELFESTMKDYERLQSEMQKVHQEYSSAINMRDTRIYELENALVEYERQAISYVNSLQQKDKEISEYINQITKLNDVSQKLKSTLDLLEEEKAKNQNAESVKSLNKQISIYQKTQGDYEERLRSLEEEKHQLSTLKSVLESKNNNIEVEIKSLQDKLKEKEVLINEIQSSKHNQSQELSEALLQAKERDEEIHEIKLQLRKESIENEKLHTSLEQKEEELKDIVKKYEVLNDKLNSMTTDQTSHSEQYIAIENKNKELLEKLKKYAISLKKKSTINADLESQLNNAREELGNQKQQVDELIFKAQKLSDVNEKLNNSNTEIIRLRAEIKSLEEKNKKLLELEEEIESLRYSSETNSETVSTLNKDLTLIQQENNELKNHIEQLNKKVVEYEIEQKNNVNLLTKLSSLENQLIQKEKEINELLSSVQHQEEKLPLIQHSYDAKIQERDLYIESLQTEMEKYKGRICRLEESISVMENSRQSLERKADQLDFQLQDKQKAYNEYISQEDELVARLAVLIDHDKVVEKRLQEIEEENKNLTTRVANIEEDLHKTQKMYQELQNKNKTLQEKANRVEDTETELSDYQNKFREMEGVIKHLKNEIQTLEIKRKTEVDDLESEFNNQMEEIVKDKKNLIEKYEKLSEQNNILNFELLQNKTTNESLKNNLRELSYRNQILEQESISVKHHNQSTDYTDQYINEINSLNSQINQRNDTINDLNAKLQSMQTDHLTSTSHLNSKISEMVLSLQSAESTIKFLEEKVKALHESIEILHAQVSQKEEQIKQLKENNKLVFEMNIPKTEGMTISSTIEPLSEDQREPDISAIESQIMDDAQINISNIEFTTKKNVESLQNVNLQDAGTSKDGDIEPLIVPKKAFKCYGENENICEEVDPFNSEEGWGLETNEETEDITPGLSQLQKEIHSLNLLNSSLKKELETSNTKLSKAIKKLKDLKHQNEMLGNELKLSKQLSDNSLLDFAIEKELASNVETLEKKVEELNVSLTKEKKDNEVLRKQNEVLKNANDRLIEIKEKADSEIQLWKYNLKQANDKLSSMQWGSDMKDLELQQGTSSSSIKLNQPSDELIKLEKENDELQMLVENLDIQNKKLLEKQKLHDIEIQNLNQQLQQQISVKCESCQQQLEKVQNLTSDIEAKNRYFNENMKSMEEKIEKLRQESDNLRLNYEKRLHLSDEQLKKLKYENDKLSERIEELKSTENEANAKIANLLSEFELLKSSNVTNDNYKQEMNALAEKYAIMEERCSKLNIALNDVNDQYRQLQITNDDLTIKCTEYEARVLQLNTDISHLNKENDQLLSTVTELRSSISSAMDQRGFEIAELWKQHLAQRESEFQTVEHGLRNQLNASQEKYEQLLENMQSSSQEETNKIVIIEQMTSLQNKIKEKEEHISNLQQKYSEAINELDILRSEIEDEKIIYENKVLVCQDEHEKQISDLRNDYENKIAELINDYEEQIKSLKVKLEEYQAELLAASEVKSTFSQDDKDNLNAFFEKQISELKSRYEEQIKSYIQKMEQLQAELIAVNTVNNNLNLELEDLQSKLESQIQELTRQLQIKDSEIFQKTHDFTISLNQRNEEFESVRKNLIEYEKKIEDLTFEKESELALLRLKMHETSENASKVQKEITDEKNRLYDALNEKIIECTNLNKIITDLNKTLEEYANKATETQMVLESQEIEIVTLKDEVANMKDILRSGSSRIEKHVTFASNTKPENENDSKLDKELLNAVPKAELDLALYMLHQRDVRCEELTMELTQLLEERDTLQLRLSDSLRSYEELRSQMNVSNVDDSSNVSMEPVSELPGPSSSEKYGASGQFVETHRAQTSRSSSISDHDGGKPNLQAKLSELRGVKHNRDVRLRHESEQRQLDMRLMHRDVANLPPEALDQLTQAQHTLSRDTQSTPTVLLNWLRGKSTPKVVHM